MKFKSENDSVFILFLERFGLDYNEYKLLSDYEKSICINEFNNLPDKYYNSLIFDLVISDIF